MNLTVSIIRTGNSFDCRIIQDGVSAALLKGYHKRVPRGSTGENQQKKWHRDWEFIKWRCAVEISRKFSHLKPVIKWEMKVWTKDGVLRDYEQNTVHF